MKVLNDVNFSDSDINKQLKFNQKISAANTLLDIYDHMKESDGLRRLEVLMIIEDELVGNDEKEGLIKKITNEL